MVAYILRLKTEFYRTLTDQLFWKQKSKYLSNIDVRQTIVKSTPLKPHEIVIIGDSQTDLFPTDALLAKKIIRQGVSGDSLFGFEGRVDSILSSLPSKLFVQGGINDIQSGTSPNSMMGAICSLTNKIKEKSPTTKLYFINIFPTNRPVRENGIDVNGAVIDYNKLLLAYCKDHGYTYINAYDSLKQGDRLNQKYDIGDQVHLNIEGFKVLSKTISPYL